MSDPRTASELSVAIALAIREDGLLLMLERRDDNPAWNHKWEFPGGKVEQGEGERDAVIRELFEETGLVPSAVEFLGVHVHDWELPDRSLRVRLHVYRCEIPSSGDVRWEKRSAYGYAWLRAEDAVEYDCLEANADLIRKFLLGTCGSLSNLGGN